VLRGKAPRKRAVDEGQKNRARSDEAVGAGPYHSFGGKAGSEGLRPRGLS